MSRLRIRIELNRGGVGVPLEKLASVVHETSRFLRMVGEDVGLPDAKGNWLGLDFDHESLNFTAEYVGAVSAEQVRAFHASFDGSTQLRRSTIAQFAAIAGAIEQDELIGFGLYQSESDADPSEWRCLSKRDALRMSEEMQALMEATGEALPDSRLPTPLTSNSGARIFQERRDRDESGHWRELEADLRDRLTRLEGKIDQNNFAVHELRSRTSDNEQAVQNMLRVFDDFFEAANRQLEGAGAEPVGRPLLTEPAPAPAPPAHVESEPHPSPRRLPSLVIPAAASAVLAIVVATYFWLAAGDGVQRGQAAGVTLAAPRTAVVESPAPPPPTPRSNVIEIVGLAPAWVAVEIGGKQVYARQMDLGDVKRFEYTGSASVLVGNASGVRVAWNGKPVGHIGPPGGVRTVQFTGDSFTIGPRK